MADTNETPAQISEPALAEVSARRLLSEAGTGFYSEKRYKIPGYTGYVPALKDTLAATPVYAQKSTFVPEEHTFLYERASSPVSAPERDPCNNPSVFRKGLPRGQAHNLWPDKQPDPRPTHCATDEDPISVKPNSVHIVNGDRRIKGKCTEYVFDYKPVFQPDPNRAIDPATRNVLGSRDPERLKAFYSQCAARVGKNNLQMIFRSMRDRLEAKIDVSTNANAFKLRRLFKMYDKRQTGRVGLPQFRLMMESFGIQMSEDQLVVVFSVYDTDGSGEIDYTRMMQSLLDGDYFNFYAAGTRG
uniref:Flagellar associated protein n=1 Tax=Tetraselmis sp. GSL018 TaxID=582737 RepID=A0A061RG03_9CHLO|mmetsp:Transcript_12007/g.28476  ORF Transcript_12007/g.28476 Transcript_12007/m.28476 type:complete len:301 (+) Transcript_12007:114-1016(+)